MGNAVIFNSGYAKLLAKLGIKLNDGTTILSGSDDPIVTNPSAANGSIYLSTLGIFSRKSGVWFKIADTSMLPASDENILSSELADNAVLADFTQTGLEIISSPIVLHGTKSFRLQHTTLIKSAKKIIAVDRKFRGKNSTITLDVVSTATNANLNIVFRDETNSVNLGTSQAITTNSQAITATTANASNQLTGMTNTVLNSLKVGMVITGSAIPVGTTITAISTTAATLSQNATGVSTGIRISSLVERKSFGVDIPANCLSFSWEISSVVEAAAESYIDDVVVQLTSVALSSTSFTVPKNNDYGSTIQNTMTIGATTTAPTKGTIVTDRIIHSRIANRLVADYQYQQSSAGAVGSGDYLFTLPNSLQFDSSVVNFHTGAIISSIFPKSVVGTAALSNVGTATYTGHLVAYDSTRFRIAVGYNTQDVKFISNVWFELTNVALGFSGHLDTPIAGWSANETESKTIPLTSAQLVQQSDSSIHLSTSNGYGATNTKVLRFANLHSSIGSGIKYEDSSTLGASFTVLEEGEYAFSFSSNSSSGNHVAITKNASGTVDASTLVGTSSCLAFASTPSTNQSATCSGTAYLLVGDIIRAQTDGVAVGITSRVVFTMSKQGSLKQLNLSSDSKIVIPTHQLRFEGASSRGATDTAIVKFDTQAITQGDAWDVVNTAANGTVVTMKKAGKLGVSANLFVAANNPVVITLNETTLNALIRSSSWRAEEVSTAADVHNLHTTFNVSVGDKIRIIAQANPTALTSNSFNLSLTENSIPANFSNVLPQWSQSDSAVEVNGLNGYGSTATKISRFSNLTTNTGDSITYADSSANGMSCTINESGLYDISLTHTSGTASEYFGITKNQSNLTSNITAVPISEILTIQRMTATANDVDSVSIQRYLVKGDVIRVCSIGSAQGTNTVFGSFNISKVGKPNLTAVDVTPFVNMKSIDVERITASVATNSADFLDRSGDFRVSQSIFSSTNRGILQINDNPASTRTEFKALKDCIINISFSVPLTTVGDVATVSLNGVILAFGHQNNTTGGYSLVSASVSINTNDILTFGCTVAASNNADRLRLTLTATADNNAIAAPTQQVSSDTMSFVFKATAITDSDPVGTFNTYTYAANTNTAVISGTAPAQTISSMNTNGVQVFSRNFNAASNSSQPARVDIKIGSGLKSRDILAYGDLAKQTAISYYSNSSSNAAEDYNSTLSYDELTGILVINIATSPSAITLRRVGVRLSDYLTYTSGYFVFNASKSPSLVTIPNLNARIATLTDVKASGVNGGSSGAGIFQTRTLNTIVDTTGIVTSLAGNSFTLQSGTYYVEASAPAYSVTRNRIRIRNTTDSTNALLGSVEYTSTAVAVTTRSVISGEITISSQKSFELQQYTQDINATGLGISSNYGENEVYSIVKITKIK